jgi:hypothetical protein
MAVVAVTGAGARALAWLFGEPGASRTVLDARIPYSVAALDEYVGARAEQHVSAQEARLLADRSYWRALQLLAAGKPAEIGHIPAAGIGCTATIATDRTKRGEHRCHVAARTALTMTTWSLTFRKGARDRSGEEEIVSRLVLNALAEACAVEARLPVQLRGDEEVVEGRATIDDPLSRLAGGEATVVTVAADGTQMAEARPGQVVLAGSFNPLHDGHIRLAEVAGSITGRPTVFEVSIANVEKPDLALAELHARLAQFRGRHSVIVTRSATFPEKAQVLPGATFVIGYDTAERLFDPRFYPAYDPAADPDGSGTAVGAALGQLMRAGARFLVAGRATDGRYHTLGDLRVPPLYRGMLDAIPEAQFRADISSTAIRQGQSTPRTLQADGQPVPRGADGQ